MKEFRVEEVKNGFIVHGRNSVEGDDWDRQWDKYVFGNLGAVTKALKAYFEEKADEAGSN